MWRSHPSSRCQEVSTLHFEESIEHGEGYVGSRENPGIQQPMGKPTRSGEEKKDQTLQFCVDYHRLNSITRKDVSTTTDWWSAGSTSRKADFHDAKSGYWQIKMEEQSKRKTAFLTFEDLYEFNVISYDLCNGPTMFQWLMQRILLVPVRFAMYMWTIFWCSPSQWMSTLST